MVPSLPLLICEFLVYMKHPPVRKTCPVSCHHFGKFWLKTAKTCTFKFITKFKQTSMPLKLVPFDIREYGDIIALGQALFLRYYIFIFVVVFTLKRKHKQLIISLL